MMRLLPTISFFALASAAPPAPCCAYGGKGAAALYGSGVWGFPGEQTSVVGFVLGASPSSGVSGVLVNSSDVETALAGWFITGNSSKQVLHAFRPASAGAPPTCVTDVLEPSQMSSGFKMCPGAADGAFSRFAASYSIGKVQVNAFVQPPGGARGNFLGAAAGCAPVSLFAGSPFGGVWSVDIEDGSADEPPATWFQMPSYCQ